MILELKLDLFVLKIVVFAEERSWFQGFWWEKYLSTICIQLP